MHAAAVAESPPKKCRILVPNLRLAWYHAKSASKNVPIAIAAHGDFVGAVAETLEAESLNRVLYPDDSTSPG